MNPQSMFGSGFGQPQLSSPFATAAGPASTTSSVFGANTGFPAGSSPQAFGSVNSTAASFGTVGSGSGFGLTPGASSNSAVFGNPGVNTGSGNAFGSPRPAASSVGPATGAQPFGASASVPAFGTSAMSQNVRFGTAGTSAPGSGATSLAAVSTASSVFGTVSTGSTFGGGGFGAGATAFGTSSSGFGTNPSPGFSTPSSGFSAGSSGFGAGSTGFGTSTAGFGSVSSASTGAPVFGISTASGFSGGSSMFGSFAAAPGTSSSLSATPSLSSPQFGGSSVFGTTMKTTGQGFPSSGTMLSSQTGSSVFGSNISSVGQGQSGGPTSLFGQTPSPTAVAGSRAASSVFGTNTGGSTFPGTTASSSGNVFGGTQAASLFRTTGMPKADSQSASAAGSFSSGGVPPPSYSQSISSGQSGLFASSSAATVFGGASRATSGEGTVFGGASRATSGEGTVFGGASRATSGEGNVFGGASRATSGEGTMFGGASRATSGEGTVFGGASRATSGEGSVFGGAGTSVIKQESSQQSSSAAGVSQPPPSALGPSHFGKFAVRKETSLADTSTHITSSASVFGGRSNFTSAFGGATRKQGSGARPETATSAGSVFGGRQREERKESLPRQPLFPAAASGLMASSGEQVKQEPGRSEQQTMGRRTGDSSGQRQTLETEGLKSGKSRPVPSSRGRDGAESTPSVSVFGGKRGFPQVEADASRPTFGFETASDLAQSQKRSAAGSGSGKEEGVTTFKRGRTEEQQQDEDWSTTGGHFQGQPSTGSGTPERARLRRSSSILEDVSSRTAIACKGIQAHVNKGAILRSHFSRFGKVKMVRPVPSKRSAVIQFETHEAASKAKNHGAMLPGQDTPVSIFFWKSSASDRSPASPEETTNSRPRWRTSEIAEARSTKGEQSSLLQQQHSSLPSSVAAELASMSGADADMDTGHRHRTVERPAQGKRSAREGLGPPRKEVPLRTRGKTPPPSSSSSSSLGSGAISLDKMVNVTASGLSKMVATTTMEMVNLLDMRDKLMRQKFSKQSSGGVHSRAFVGTCPDMCPEKERLYREEMRRLSIFEIIPGSSTLTGSTSLVDHTKAVKEYSRSSADQDEPLPHELRPLHVLTMTMNYLLAEVADCGEDGKWAEWYDFLWNRTRSIRKEITQQQLCSQAVVDLVEKCVRFHIYCSERLCMEDMMVFDSKINNENLTKCLQTLKELYADMENKQGLFCPNEAEFRAYIVLMNLNEGDTLREVQQLRQEVRASAEIGFAVKAYSTLNANNYVRFFRVVRSASFLNACILHRYFNQIRARALQIILRSHTAGQKKIGFPLSELQRLLYFEDEEEIREFCSYYGLHTGRAELVLDRSAFVEPETSIPSWRAVGLVEFKRLASVGEVINGGSLQPVHLSTPQSSFDEHGRFIGNLEGLVDDSQDSQEKAKPFTIKAVPRPPQLQPSPLQQPSGGEGGVPPVGDVPAGERQVVVSNNSADGAKQQLKPSSEVLKTIARDLFFEVIEEHAHQVAETVISTQQMMRQCEADIASEMTSSVIADLAREVGREAVEAERARQNQRLAAERREREERVAADILASVLTSAVEEQAEEIALKEIEEARARERAERQERCLLEVHRELVQQVSGEVAMEVAEEVHQVEVVARLQLLGDLQKVLELRRTSQWLAVWRKALKLRQRQKRAMLDFPCAPPMQLATHRLQSLYPDRADHALSLLPGKAALLVNRRAQMTLLSPLESEQRSLTLSAHLSLASLVSSLQRARAWQPLCLASLLRGPLNQAIQQWPCHFVTELSPLNVQWKVLLSLPGEMEEGEEDSTETGAGTQDQLMPVLKQWLCAKLTRGDRGRTNAADPSKKNVLSQYSVDVASNAAAPPRLRVGVCVRSVPEFAKRAKREQPTKEQSLSITKGTSAVLFLLPHADTSDDTVWLAARLRLARLLEAKPALPATPLALLLPCGPTTPPGSLRDEVTCRLGVEGFQDLGLVSGVAVVELAVRGGQSPDVALTAPALQSQVLEAVKFLASRAPEPPALRRERVGDVVEGMLTQHFFTPVLQDLRSRLALGKLHQAPNILIGLYNSVLDHICMALTSPALQDISWPAPELQLSAGTREDWNSNEHLGDIYELVSGLRLPWFHYKDPESTEWSQVCHDVWTFVNTVVKKRCNTSVSLTSRISRVLAHACLQFENVCSLTHNEDHCTPTYVNAPWTDIVVACAEFRLQRLHSWKDTEEEVGGDLEVLYEEEDLEEFEPPAPWVQAVLDTEDTEGQKLDDTVGQASIIHFASQPAVEEDIFIDNNPRSKPGREDAERRNQSASLSGREDHAAPPCHSDLPNNVRSALETSEKLLLHVEEERQQAQAFERYLEKALRGDTSPDWNLSAIPSSPSTPQLVPRPALSSATPVSAIRKRGGTDSLSTPRDRGVGGGNLPLRYSPEPRRLSEQGRRGVRFAREEAMEAEQVHQENLPLSEGVELFKENLQAQRYANELFQRRLQSLLES